MTDVVTTVSALRARLSSWRAAGERIALVPTMGALHAGHLALVARARSEVDRVVVSIFVNPTQFAPNEDFATYPRNLDSDLAALQDAADLLYAPQVSEMYPEGAATVVTVGGPAAGLESDARPHFFAGVATVVTKLLIQCAPDIAVFGEKDFQQLAVVRRLVRDLSLPVEIVGGETVRETSGLALSSRNAYFSPADRTRAAALYAALDAAAAEIGDGGNPERAIAVARLQIERAGFAIDYLELRDAETLASSDASEDRPMRLLVAARLSNVRLIDNVGVTKSLRPQAVVASRR
ncbi:pantoate--beta-alanine ligase [Hansschlegelia plantiphila]|uniref:Pantothenate synthetase n=1 Tax=Hansschlegelia plantiphila TaxID=374655 RepID=A0A9W6IZV1_9HYPH|nr:pantoate--beta-alanine ligase [Hansschlegelia plantiphila]GLK68236.1 pantothenate synthetase [Hansschlegelia plantiphila]